MAAIRMSSDHWARTYAHLFTRAGEHFAFFLADWTLSGGRPVFMVKDVLLVDDADVKVTRSGWEVSNVALTRIVSAAAKANRALIEVHNHGGALPRFSGTDRDGFAEIVPYMLDSLRGRPYGATVWGDDTIYAEYFRPGERSAVIDSIVVHGNRLDQVVSRDDDQRVGNARFGRQAPWFTDRGQRKLARLRIGIVGAGGTGGQVVQNLVYLGARDFVVVDHDDSDETSMNRLVTAEAADIGTAKAVLARRLAKAVAPDACVEIIPDQLQSPRALDALKGVDVLFGCVDNDGARMVLNELALAYEIPYFDLAVGIEAEDGRLDEAGGRVCAVLAAGPCLNCMRQIDPAEARYWLATEEQRGFMRQQGYVNGMNIRAPSVVGLNAAVAAAAVNELAMYVSGARPVQPWLEIDLLGRGRAVKSQWIAPVRATRLPNCPACEHSGVGDAARIEQRYRRER